MMRLNLHRADADHRSREHAELLAALPARPPLEGLRMVVAHAKQLFIDALDRWCNQSLVRTMENPVERKHGEFFRESGGRPQR